MLPEADTQATLPDHAPVQASEVHSASEAASLPDPG